MSGGDFGGRLYRVGFSAGFSFEFSFLCRFSFLSCCLFCLPVGVCACYGQRVGSWEYRDDGKDEEEDGGRGEPRASHQVTGEELWWEHGSHHYKATHLSGYVTG
jgi:hypothetical protein